MSDQRDRQGRLSWTGFSWITFRSATGGTSSESQIRHLYSFGYLPLLASHERSNWERLEQISKESGLILSLDGLTPEEEEPQLWVVHELQTGLTLPTLMWTGEKTPPSLSMA